MDVTILRQPYAPELKIKPAIRRNNVANVEELFADLMTEEEAWNLKPCDDTSLLTSTAKTKVYIQDNKKRYRLNDRIRLTIVAYDKNGKPKKEGGDQFRASIKSNYKNAYGVGIVTDHANGTYTVAFDALWVGNASIEVTLAYTKQATAAIIRSRMKTLPSTYTVARYQKGKMFEEGYCNPNRTMLKYDEACIKPSLVKNSVCTKEGITPNRTQVCNFTSLDDGFPLYCFKPISTTLNCNDWKYIRRRKIKQTTPGMTNCERTAVSSFQQKLTTKLAVKILPKNSKDKREIIDLPTTSCSAYNKTKLWLLKEPTGFFYNGTWHLRHCNGVKIDNIEKCMKNKILYIIGDSTMRQWYQNILKRYNCVQYTEEWTNSRWYSKSACRNSRLNFTTIYAVHSLPFNVFGMSEVSYYLTSIGQRLNAIRNDENVVFVFHIFGHMSYFHPDFYRLKLKTIRKPAENLLNRNKKAKIMIKAPHVFEESRDILGYIYNRIIYEVFDNLYDRIFYLNNRDSSTPLTVESIHPIDMVVEAMVDQTFVYACD